MRNLEFGELCFQALRYLWTAGGPIAETLAAIINPYGLRSW